MTDVADHGFQNGDRILLARLDERSREIETRLEKMITRAEFQPVKNAVYGLVALILLGFGTAVIKLVGFGA